MARNINGKKTRKLFPVTHSLPVSLPLFLLYTPTLVSLFSKKVLTEIVDVICCSIQFNDEMLKMMMRLFRMVQWVDYWFDLVWLRLALFCSLNCARTWACECLRVCVCVCVVAPNYIKQLERMRKMQTGITGDFRWMSFHRWMVAPAWKCAFWIHLYQSIKFLCSVGFFAISFRLFWHRFLANISSSLDCLEMMFTLQFIFLQMSSSFPFFFVFI